MLCGKDNVNLNLTREVVNVVENPPVGVGVKRAKVSALDDVLVDEVDPTPLPSLRKKKIPARSDLAANVPLFDETGKAEVFGLDDKCQRSGSKFERESFIRFITALSKWFTLHCESPVDSKEKISVGLKSARDFFYQNVEGFRHSSFDAVFTFDDVFINLGTPIDVIGFNGKHLL